MKVAIVHDYIKEYGGAERVLESLTKVFPGASVYTTIYLPLFLGPHRKRFENLNIKTSWAQNLPFNSKLISPLRLIAPLLFKSFDFKGFDLVIVSQTGAYTPNSIIKKGAMQICYSHTPPRYLYGYATAREWKKNVLFKVLGEIANHFFRLIDYKSCQNVDYFISNSGNVKKRIQKFYRKDAFIIYPPVQTAIKNTKSKTRDKKYYLTGGRLARPKHTDLIIEAFSKNKLLLKVFGKDFAGYGEELKAKAGKNIEFLGEITDEAKYRLMSNAKAFIFASEDEDFGITPVEAQASGTPVIAFRSGGVLESIIDGKTGIFFNRLSVTSIQEAIDKFENIKINPDDCIKSAQRFSEEKFIHGIHNFVNSKLKNQNL